MTELVAELMRKMDQMDQMVQRMAKQLEDIRRVLDAPRVMRQVRHCQRKSAYDSAKDALNVIRELRRRHQTHPSGTPKRRSRTAERLRYYKCPVCDKYHLTKKEPE
jgi:hypothetical protein